jgi:hypothetical protein
MLCSSRAIRFAVLFVPFFCASGCDLATVADIAGIEAPAAEDREWGPFRMGMSLDEVQKIIKAKTGKPGDVLRLPGSKWDTILYDGKMIMIMDGTLLSVMAEEYHDPDAKLD